MIGQNKIATSTFLQTPETPMPFIESFQPVIGTSPRVLILGSIPGIALLQVQQYYAHPRNVFWSIMAQLFDVEWSDDYTSKIQQVKCFPVILWDTLKACLQPVQLMPVKTFSKNLKTRRLSKLI